MCGIQTAVFPGTDGPLPLACCVGVGGAAAVFQNAGDIVRIQNAELGFEPQHMAVLAHDAHTQCVKCANQDFLGAPANEFFGTLAHFAGSFVGKGDGRNAFGFQSNFNEARYFLGNDARLARACSRQNQTRAFDVIDGFQLSSI